MRDYGKVFSSFWTSQTIRTMDDDSRTLAIYLLTCPHGTISGVFRLPDGYVCDDLNWEKIRVIKAFETLSKGFANRCETTKWVWINKHFDWNKPENPLQLKGAKKIALTIPDECSWKLDYMRLYADLLGIDIKPFRNPLQTLSKPVAVAVAVAVTVTEAVAVAVVCGKKTHTQIQTSLISDGLKSIGMMPINPSLPKFIALVDAGATADEFVSTALEKRGTDKFNFNYLLTVMGNRRADAARAPPLHKGAMPASTSREAGRNIAAKSVFTPENTKHLQGVKLNLIGEEHEVRAITN